MLYMYYEKVTSIKIIIAVVSDKVNNLSLALRIFSWLIIKVVVLWHNFLLIHHDLPHFVLLNLNEADVKRELSAVTI